MKSRHRNVAIKDVNICKCVSNIYLFIVNVNEKIVIEFKTFVYYLVLAEPHIGLCKLLHEPSSERYGDLTQRFGGMAQRGPLDTCFECDAKLLEKWMT